MSLIKCSECNQDVSTLGAACPHCGTPIASKAVPQPVVSQPVAGESPSAVVPAAKSITSLAEIAKCQKSVLWMGLLNLAGLVASLWFPIVGLAVGVILIFFIYRLAAALHTMAWLYAIAAIVPVVGLFSLLHLDRMATRALQKADLKVGLMGVTEEELPISVTGIIPSSSAGATTMLEKGEKHMKASGVFLAVLAAIAVAVFIFAPERLPSGIGLVPVPMEVRTRPSLAGEGQVAIISNPTGKTLHNVLLFCRNSSTNEEKTYLEETWVPGKSIEIGWVEGWRFLSGETLTISASGYASKTWNW